jgi:predicted nuclease with TOPRIM domain
MEKLTGFFKSKYVIGFGLGLAAALIGYQACKSKKLRKAVVKAVARGMKLRDDAKFALNTIKEDAEDLCAEAKEEGSAAPQEGAGA